MEDTLFALELHLWSSYFAHYLLTAATQTIYLLAWHYEVISVTGCRYYIWINQVLRAGSQTEDEKRGDTSTKFPILKIECAVSNLLIEVDPEHEDRTLSHKRVIFSFILANRHTVNLGVVFRTGAVWRRAAPLAVQLAHSRRVADDGTLADAAVADDWAYCPTVARDLGVGRHAGAVTQHHCPIRADR